MTTPVTTPTTQQQTTVAAYFTEAGSPTVIGTSGAQPHLLDALQTAGYVLEQCGKSRRLLNFAKLAEMDSAFQQYCENINQALAATARDCEEVQRLLLQLAQHSAAIDKANADAKAAAIALGYVIA